MSKRWKEREILQQEQTEGWPTSATPWHGPAWSWAQSWSWPPCVRSPWRWTPCQNSSAGTARAQSAPVPRPPETPRMGAAEERVKNKNANCQIWFGLECLNCFVCKEIGWARRQGQNSVHFFPFQLNIQMDFTFSICLFFEMCWGGGGGGEITAPYPPSSLVKSDAEAGCRWCCLLTQQVTKICKNNITRHKGM